MRLALGLLPLLFTGCGAALAMLVSFDCRNAYVDDRYEADATTSYDVNPDAVTPDGISVDTSGFDVDLERIDALSTETERCLDTPIRRCGFRVKVAPDWTWIECRQLEGYPCNVNMSCDSETCPCGCTGNVQYPSTIVITPNLAAYKHELIHVVTRADHSDERFAACQ